MVRDLHKVRGGAGQDPGQVPGRGGSNSRAASTGSLPQGPGDHVYMGQVLP